MSDNPPGAEVPLSSLLPTSTGRIVSTRGLLERILEQFRAEVDEARLAAASPVEQRTLVRDVALYVFSVENVVLSREQQAHLIQRAASELLGYGGLDALFSDETICTILIDGLEGLAVRRSPGGDLETRATVFDDQAHLRRIIERLLLRAGTDPAAAAIVETGVTLQQRRLSLNVALPPTVTQVQADIRLHPAQPVMLDEWLARGYVTPDMARVLHAIAASRHGFMIAGDTESGKTTLLGMMARLMPGRVVSVERAGEMALPEGAVQLSASQQGRDLAGLVRLALGMRPDALLLDEVRADEPAAIAPLLLEPAPRLAWSLRGTSEPKRMKAALAILVQRACGAQAGEALSALFERLPFLLLLKRRRGALQLVEVAEWQPDRTEVQLVTLLRHDDMRSAPSQRLAE